MDGLRPGCGVSVQVGVVRPSHAPPDQCVNVSVALDAVRVTGTGGSDW